LGGGGLGVVLTHVRPPFGDVCPVAGGFCRKTKKEPLDLKFIKSKGS
jgi:hypothetical protein